MKVPLSSQEVRILIFHFAATCSHLQVAASDCYCYFCPENIMISAHAVLKQTKISPMLFYEEPSCARRHHEIIQDFSKNKCKASAELATLLQS